MRGYIKLLLLLILNLALFGCSSLPIPEYGQVIYDYQVKPEYEMNESYKYFHISIDARDVSLPEKKFNDESIKFAWSSSNTNSQLVVYINLSNSFLIDRENAIKDELIYDMNGKKGFIRTPIQRGFIRTRYTIELIDRTKDKLINSVNLAGNFSIEAELTNSADKNRKILKAAYYENIKEARKKLVSDIWSDLKKYHLSSIQTTFRKIEYSIVSKLAVEPKFEQAYLLLMTNRKRNAVKALNIYNKGVALYKDKQDDLSLMILKHLDDGITASTSIANNEYPDRYR
ncbi:MAG: hypothetical protein ACJA0E_001196 [Bermanella sp.]|jgi:hypothetical protein